MDEIVSSVEDVLVRDSIRSLLEESCSPALVKSLHKSGAKHSDELWQRITEAGWHSFWMSDRYGGMNGSIHQLYIVLKEAGRFLVPPSFLDAVIALRILVSMAPDQSESEVLVGIANGELIPAVATAPYRITRTSRNTEGKTLVSWNADIADIFILISTDSRSPYVGWISADALTESAKRESPAFGGGALWRLDIGAIDPSRINMVSDGNNTAEVVSRSIDWARLLKTFEMIGGFEAVLDMTSEYVKQRVQFGKPIGSFQAVQHILADVSSRLHVANLLARHAYSEITSPRSTPQRTIACASAKAWASRSYVDATLMAHQLFGGVGYSKDSDLFLWSEHAKVSSLRFGGYDESVMSIARLLSDVEKHTRCIGNEDLETDL